MVSGMSNNTSVCIQLREITIFLSSLQMLNFEKKQEEKQNYKIIYLPSSNLITEVVII